MNQEKGKEINQVNAPVSDAAEVAGTGELSERDLTEISGGLIFPQPTTKIKGKKYTNVSGCSIII
ncbi:MAG: hypothetical protein HZC43_04805 [Nitrosomonadales bacterium]|nr:hypothetical protein [Nitrosomonadales bacterium]